MDNYNENNYEETNIKEEIPVNDTEKKPKKRKKQSIDLIDEQIKALQEKKQERLNKLYIKTGKIVIDILSSNGIEIADIEVSDLFFDELKVQTENSIENYKDTIE